MHESSKARQFRQMAFVLPGTLKTADKRPAIADRISRADIYTIAIQKRLARVDMNMDMGSTKANPLVQGFK
jgi:hypothetical protein